MKTPAKKATKTATKAAKVAAPSKKVSAKPPSKNPAAVAKAKSAAVKKTTQVASRAKPAAKGKPAPAKAKPAVKAKPVAAKAKPVAAKAKPVAAKAKARPAAKTKGKASVPVKAPAKRSAPAPKTPAKVATGKKPLAKAAPTAKVKPAKAKLAPAAKAVAKTPAGAKPQALTPAKPQAPVAPPANPKPMPGVSPVTTTPDLPVRSSRPSARLAQITVPSMPQAVASTAAKASFLPSMPTPVLPAPIAPAKKDPKLAQNWKKKPPEQLTDAEVLAMPDSEYMNDVQMAFFRLKLVQLKQGILNNAGETTEHLREDTVVVPDPADRATIEEEHALELRTRDRERKLLKKIEQSIARIDAGDYGYCDETGEPIGVGRLLARPTATLSLEAQQRRELKQKMFGD